MNDTVTLFLDTNCFLQMRDLNQVDWKQAFPDARSVNIVVCDAVIRELDVHKMSHNERLRKRARAALKTIEKASNSDDGAILKQKNPQLQLLPLMGQIDWQSIERPPSDHADDILVAAAKSHSVEAIVFSCDTGPRIKARQIGLRAMEPPEDWMLPAEPSQASKRIAKIEREVETLRSRSPELSLDVVGLHDGAVLLEAVHGEKLGDETINRLAKYVLDRNPMHYVEATVHGPMGMVSLHGISEHAVSQYESEYSQFRVEVDQYFRGLHDQIFLGTHLRALPVRIENHGAASAHNLCVSIDVENPLRLMADQSDAESFGATLALPEEPDPPSEHGILARMPHLDGIVNRPKNPTRFRWANRPDEAGDSHGMKICEDFRPKRSAEIELLLFTLKIPNEAQIKIEVSAENQESLHEQFTVKFAEGRSEWSDEWLRAMLPADVRSAFESLGNDHDYFC